MTVHKFPIHNTQILKYMGNYYKLSQESEALALMWLAQEVPEQLQDQIVDTVKDLTKDKR